VAQSVNIINPFRYEETEVKRDLLILLKVTELVENLNPNQGNLHMLTQLKYIGH